MKTVINKQIPLQFTILQTKRKDKRTTLFRFEPKVEIFSYHPALSIVPTSAAKFWYRIKIGYVKFGCRYDIDTTTTIRGGVNV